MFPMLGMPEGRECRLGLAKIKKPAHVKRFLVSF
jgi:hypothetical protein